MFWFVFISIILFIVFLIILLFSSQSSNDNTARRLKDELVAKNKIREEKLPVSRKAEAKPKTAPKKRQAPKVEESVAAAAAVEEIPVVEEKAPSVVEMIPEIEESASKEAAEKLPEEAFVAEDTVEEAVAEESVAETFEVAAEYEMPESEEPSPAAEEALIIEEAFEPSVEDVTAEVEEAVSPEPMIEEVTTAIVGEAAAVEEEPVSEEVEVTAAEEAYNYLPFDNTRAMEEFGLPKEDADLFIVDLIAQIEDEMPALQVAVEARDNKKIEDISHMIKGSATNLGTGGAADVLVDFNTYMKTGDDPVVIAAHMRNLNRALADLKEQFQ
jgi:hypothetical protein